MKTFIFHFNEYLVVILGERPVAARLPGQLGGEGGEDVVEAVAHDDVVVNGNCIISYH